MSRPLNRATTGVITREQFKLLEELNKRGSMDSLAHTVKGIELDWFQTKALAHALITKGSIVSLDTGLGKTLVAVGHMNIIKQWYPNSKILFICERSNFENTIRKIKDHSDLTVIGTTAEGEVIWNNFISKEPMHHDVWVLTYQSLQNIFVNKYLFDNKHLIKSIVIDESHKIGNESSFTHQIVRAMCNQFEYKLFLTATPLRVSPRQMVYQIEMLDRTMFEDRESYCRRFEDRDVNGQVVGYFDLPQMASDLSVRFIGYTREELGLRGNYNIRLIISEPKDEYYGINRSEMNRIIKADPTGDAVYKTINEVISKTKQGKKGLIYANLNETKQLLFNCLASQGIRVDIIDGSLSNPKLRNETQMRFNRGELDVIIINVTTALDLQCDYILFHELTVDSKQMIGRGERGLQANDLELIYIISAYTVEVDYFLENVYARGLILKELANKEIHELESIRNQLDRKGQTYELD